MLVLTALAASSVLVLSAVNAQGHGPAAFLYMTSAAAKDAIYYHGGQLNTQQTTYTDELWQLDVTKSWPISSPAWSNLTVPGGPRVADHSATLSKDHSTLMLTNPSGGSSPFLYLFNIKSKTWSSVPAPAAQATSWATRRDVYFNTDSNSGNVWMIGGILANNQVTNSVDKFDPSSGQWTSDTISPSANPQLDPYSTGTSHFYNGKIYIFGGYDSPAGQRGYQSFQRLPYVDVSDPNNPVVGGQLTLGPTPPSRQDHCSVRTDSDKVFIFGGYDANSKQTLNDMWVLDLPTWTWRHVIPQVEPRPRRQHVCNIVGANMVVFGGAGLNATGYANDVQVYDVMQSTWLSSYAPKQDTTPKTPSLSGGGGSNGSSGGLSTGAIIGIAVGAVVVIFIGFSVFFFKRRQRQIEIREAELEKEAYLASLRPEPSASGSGGKQAGPSSPADSRMAFTSKDMGSPAYYTDAAGSPLPAATPGVQYLMQHLPDGTIAVQPVYVDATSLSPAAASATDPDAEGYISPSTVLGGNVPSSGGYMSPSTATMPAASSAAHTNAVGYPVPYPPPAAHHYGHEAAPAQDPFASPVMGNTAANSAVPSPLPPPPPTVGSPQHGHPDAHYGHHR